MIEDNSTHESLVSSFVAAKPLILAGGTHALAMRMTAREAQQVERALRHNDRFPPNEYTIAVDHTEDGQAVFTIQYITDA